MGESSSQSIARLSGLRVCAIQQTGASVMSVSVTPLRQRMIDDMAIRNMSPLTQKAYVRAVKNFSAFYKQSPNKLTFEDVRNYQLHLMSRGPEVATIIPIMCAFAYLARYTHRVAIGNGRLVELTDTDVSF